MEISEPEVLPPCSLGGVCGCYTPEEVEVIKAALTYLGVNSIQCRQARLILLFIRKVYERGRKR